MYLSPLDYLTSFRSRADNFSFLLYFLLSLLLVSKCNGKRVFKFKPMKWEWLWILPQGFLWCIPDPIWIVWGIFHHHRHQPLFFLFSTLTVPPKPSYESRRRRFEVAAAHQCPSSIFAIKSTSPTSREESSTGFSPLFATSTSKLSSESPVAGSATRSHSFNNNA